MNKIFSKFFIVPVAVLGMFLGISTEVKAGTFAGGDGSSGNPYQITNCLELQSILDSTSAESDATANYKLMNDIDCAATNISDTDNENYNNSLYHDGSGFMPIGESYVFQGVFDGNNHKVSNLYVNRYTAFVGMFSQVNNAEIKNLNLVNLDTTNDGTTGGLAGYIRNSTVRKVSIVGGTVNGGGSGQYVGGLVGFSGNSHIENSFTRNTVIGRSDVGGLVGGSSVNEYPFMGTSVVDSYSTSDVTGVDHVGGLIGYVYKDPISNSYSTGVVNGSGLYIGGLIGFVDTEGNGNYEDYIFNCGWYQNNSGPEYAIGETGNGTPGNVDYNVRPTYREGFLKDGADWFYDQTRSIYTTTGNSEPVWAFRSSLWNSHPSDYPDFTREPGGSGSTKKHRGGGGTTIPERVNNLFKMGKDDEARSLMDKWPQYFPKATSTVQTVSANQIVDNKETQFFLRNLKLGSIDTDVKRLQEFLNKKGFIVSVSGPGSLGNETTYFGKATRDALIKYQEANSADILIPNGLVKGTGNFFEATRNFVNKTFLK